MFFLQQWSSAFTGYRRIHFTLMEASKELNKYGAIETTKGSLGFKTLEELMKVILKFSNRKRCVCQPV